MPACSSPSARSARCGVEQHAHFGGGKRRSMSQRLEAFTLFSSSKGNSALFRYGPGMRPHRRGRLGACAERVAAGAWDVAVRDSGDFRHARAQRPYQGAGDDFQGLLHPDLRALPLLPRHSRQMPERGGSAVFAGRSDRAWSVFDAAVPDPARRGGFGLLPRRRAPPPSATRPTSATSPPVSAAASSAATRSSSKATTISICSKTALTRPAAEKADSRRVRAPLQPLLRGGAAAAGRERRAPHRARAPFAQNNRPALAYSESRGALAARSITVAGESVSADVSLAVASPCEPVRVL